MSAGGGFVAGLILSPIKVITWCVILLCAVGAVGTAAAFSDVSMRALFTGIGVVISDLDEIGDNITAGQDAGEAQDGN